MFVSSSLCMSVSAFVCLSVCISLSVHNVCICTSACVSVCVCVPVCLSMRLMSGECVFPPDNSFLKQVLEGEYPKLLRLYTDLWRRILSLGVKVDLPSSLQVEDSAPLDLQHQQLMEQTALDSGYE